MEIIKTAVLGVYHHDCQTSLSSEKFPGVELEQTSPIVYFSKKDKRLDYSLLWRINASSPSELEEYLNYVKNDSTTKSMRVLEKSGGNAHILLRFSGPTSTYGTVLSAGVTYASNVLAKAGFEIHTVLSPDPKRLGKMMNELTSIGDVKVIKVGELKHGALSPIPKFTDKQLGALQLALMNDYYNWPRSATLEKLAKAARISRRSFQERLRRAETKLIPFAIKELLKKRF